MTEPEVAARPRPSRRRLILRVTLAVAVVAIIYFGLLPKLVDVGEVGATLRAMTWLELVSLSAVAIWNLVSYLLPQLVALGYLGVLLLVFANLLLLFIKQGRNVPNKYGASPVAFSFAKGRA